MKKSYYEMIIKNNVKNEPELTASFILLKAHSTLNEIGFYIWTRDIKHQNTHAHDYYQLWYILRGNCKHRIDNKKYILNTGDIIVIPPFSYHSMSDGSDDLIVIGMDFTSKFFSSGNTDTKIMASCINPIFMNSAKSDSAVFNANSTEDLILEIYNEYINKKEFYEIVIKSNLTKILITLDRIHKSKKSGIPSKHDQAISETIRYIHNHFHEKIKIETLSRMSNMSITLFSAKFKELCDKTVVEYINSLRIDKSKQLLSETDMSITDISLELGYNDASYFNRVFKREEGKTPRQYRKLKRNI